MDKVLLAGFGEATAEKIKKAAGKLAICGISIEEATQRIISVLRQIEEPIKKLFEEITKILEPPKTTKIERMMNAERVKARKSKDVERIKLYERMRIKKVRRKYIPP